MLAGGLFVSPSPSQANIAITLTKENLSTAQINELRGAMKTRAEKILSQVSRSGLFRLFLWIDEVLGGLTVAFAVRKECQWGGLPGWSSSSHQ